MNKCTLGLCSLHISNPTVEGCESCPAEACPICPWVVKLHPAFLRLKWLSKLSRSCTVSLASVFPLPSHVVRLLSVCASLPSLFPVSYFPIFLCFFTTPKISVSIQYPLSLLHTFSPIHFLNDGLSSIYHFCACH